MSVSENNRRIARNTLLLYGRKAVTMLIALYSSRVLLQYLGIDDFGLYGLVGSIILVFTSLKSTFAASVQRFLNVNKEESIARENEIFCMGMIIHVLIAVVFILLAEIGGAILLPNLNLNSEKLIVAGCILHFTIFSAAVSIITVPFDALAMANEKFDALAVISVIDSVLRLCVIFILSFSPIQRVVFYAILLLCVTIVHILMIGGYCYKTFKTTVKFHFVKDKVLFKRMTAFAGWNFFGNLGYYLTSEGVNFILNIFGGIVANASRAISYQVKNALQTLVNDITVAFQPQSMMAFSTDKQRFYNLQFLATKARFAICVVLGFPLFLFIPEILQVWLGKQPEGAATFIRCILLFVAIRCWHDAIDTTFKSAACMRNYQICEMSIMLFNLPVSWLMLHLKLPLYSVFIVMSVIEFVNLIAIMMLAYKELDFIIGDYIKEVIIPSVFIICIMGIIYLSCSFFDIRPFGWIEMVFFLIGAFSIAIGLIFMVLFSRIEREKLVSMMKYK